MSTDEILRAFAARGAGEMEHPGGTLLDHLTRTAERLRSWGAADALVRAGAAHAAYGTDGYPAGVFDWGERDAIATLLGADAEAIVHCYGRCDRAFTLARLATEQRCRDRLDGTVVDLDDRTARALAHLTVANELDVVTHSRSIREQHAESLRSLFKSWRRMLSAAAIDDCGLVLGDPDAGPEHQDVLAGGVRLHVLRYGSCDYRPVLFAHGGGLNAYVWDPICRDLAKDHHCVSVDLRGHGDSEWSPSVDYTVEAHAYDLRHLIEALGMDRPVLVGHSLGGYAAIRYAAGNASELAGLVLVDTDPFVTSQEPGLVKLRAFASRAPVFNTFDDAVAHARTISPSDDDRLRKSLRRALRQLSDGRWTWKRDHRLLDDRYFESVRQDANKLVASLSEVTCPTLVVRGEHGMSPHDTARLCAALPAARSVTIPDSGHNVHSDNAPDLLDAIKSFLAH